MKYTRVEGGGINRKYLIIILIILIISTTTTASPGHQGGYTQYPTQEGVDLDKYNVQRGEEVVKYTFGSRKIRN